MHSILRIMRHTSALWPFYLGVTAVSIITSLLGLLSPFILREITDTIVSTLSGDSELKRVSGILLALVLILFAADFSHAITQNIGGYIGDTMAANMRKILSNRYFAQLLVLPQRYFDNQSTGTLIARLDRSITSVTQFLQSFANNFLPMLITVAAVLGVTAWYFWPLAVLLALLFPIYTWLTALTSTKWQKIEFEKNVEVDHAGGRFAEVIGQIKVTKSFVAERKEFETFAQRFARTVSLTKKQSSFWHRMDTLRGMAISIIFLAIYITLFWRTLHGFFTLGDMVMLLQLVNMAKQPVYMMSWIVNSAQQAVAGSRDYFDVMRHSAEPGATPQLIRAAQSDREADRTNTTQEAKPSPTPQDPQKEPQDPRNPHNKRNLRNAQKPHDVTTAPPDISFEDVSFSYEPGKPILHNITFGIPSRARFALVGESGSGKSTIVNLLLGLYLPTSGRINVLGHDTATASTDELRSLIGVVFQEPGLFSGTIRENIAYGRPDATDEEIKHVAQRANAHDFINAFPDGYNAVIGERGLRLSGGQKQRIAIARAMLKDAPILILDEATSALDNRSERLVQDGLTELMRDRTTLLIAHRLSTIASVDTIVTLDRGRIQEIGSPSDLASSGGIYAELLALAASGAAADQHRLKAFGLTHGTPKP